MARNSEKNFGRLNRLWLHKEGVKKEKRPKLSTLKTTEEIATWLPSIKNELDFFLKQTEVPCYTEQKVQECRKRIMHLEAEYKAFVRKLQLTSKLKTIPWTARPYESKSKGNEDRLTLHAWDAEKQLRCIRPLPTPVLMHDELYSEHSDGECSLLPETSESQQKIGEHPDIAAFPLCDVQLSKAGCSSSLKNLECIVAKAADIESREASLISQSPPHDAAAGNKHSVLGLDYSSSSEEDT